ncbi:MAG: hypothetical protein SFY96_10895 [Planctomycetota bacterium]|nr:hypothetical protein [Planctomycetota bacterium]
MLPGIPVLLRFGVVAMQNALGLIFWIVAAGLVIRRFGRYRPNTIIKATPSASARVKVVGRRGQLRHFLARPATSGEPMSFLLLFAKPERGPWKYAIAVTLCVCVGVAAGVAWPSQKLGFLAGSVAGACTAIFAFGVLWPAYLRVSPGRLDVLRGGWGTSLRRVASVDLRHATIWIDLRRRRIFLKEPGKRLVWFSTDLTGRRCALARAIVAAALTAQAPIPLPDDALVG